MPKFVITELQRVMAVRLVEAETEEDALAAFNEGEGEPCGKNGEVTGADLISIDPDTGTSSPD